MHESSHNHNARIFLVTQQLHLKIFQVFVFHLRTPAENSTHVYGHNYNSKVNKIDFGENH